MNNNNQQACPRCRHMNATNSAICELCGFIYAKEGMTITYCPRSSNQSQGTFGNENETIAPPSFAISDDDATFIPQGAPEGGQAKEPSGVANDPMAHFKIFDVLGKGGMGAIYKAQDLTLERFVALKLFYSQAAVNSQTLLDEARLACKLNHPNIVTIYDIARGQNSNFIVMEWVDGQTLDQLIPENGLPESKALEFACQIAEGLACAHQNGIIHRDIKPQNIMLNKEGRIKILDFGIAELLRQSNKAATASKEGNETSVGDATRMSGLSGTPKYMAPEQARGEALDQQADIFSFGILLYEMLTGERPFHASNLKELRYELEKGSYRPFKEIHPHLSNEFVNIVEKMLAPNKTARWQTSTELVEALKQVFSELTQPKNWWQRRHWISKAAMVLPFVFAIGWSAKEIIFPPTTQELVERQVAEAKKIAVLPLDNISGDPVLQLFSDGLITTLSSDLAAAGLEQGDGTTWVIPSSEIRRMRDVSVKAVNDKFGVDLVVSGSIQHMGSTRSVVLNLINARDGRQLSTSQLVIDAENLFKGQDSIRQEVLKLLNWNVSNKLVEKYSSQRPQFDGAYKSYLEAKGYVYRYDIEGNLDKALVAFNEAINQDPSYEDAIIGLAETQILLFRQFKKVQLLTEVSQTIEQLILLNPNNKKSDFLLAEVAMQRGNYESAADLYRENIKINSEDFSSWMGLAKAESKLGNNDKAEEVYRFLSEKSPNNWKIVSAYGIYLFKNGNYQSALKQFDLLIKMSPNNDFGYRNGAAVHYSMGNIESAIVFAKKAIELRPSYYSYLNLGSMFFYLEKYEDAIVAFGEAIKIQSDNYLSWGNIGDAYKLINEEQKSKNAYQKASTLAQDTLRLNPNDSVATALLSYYFANLKLREQSIGIAQKITDNSPGFENFIVSTAYESLGSIDMSLHHLEIALRKNYSIDEITKTPFLTLTRKDKRFHSLILDYKNDSSAR